MAPTARPPLLVFADDWGRHPSSCQHLIARLLPEHIVLWVNTIGTRVPGLDLATVRRGFGKIRQWFRPGENKQTLPANLRVLNPVMWPSFSSAAQRRLNRFLLARQLRKALRELPEPPIAVTTLPVTADLIGALPVRRWVYYCVDDFSRWPGLDQVALARMEIALVRKVDRLIAAGPNLQERLARMGRSACLVSHGVDLDFWRQPTESINLPFLKSLPHPLVVFWGLLDRRMDIAWVQRLGQDMRSGSIVLAGPENDADPRLRALPRVVLPGELPIDRLPALARAADVLIMPYADLPVTRAMQPLKLKEYLATDKPVVVRNLPGNREWADCLDLASDAESFSQSVRERLMTGLPSEQRIARTRLESESWQSKARLFQAALLEQELPLAKCS